MGKSEHKCPVVREQIAAAVTAILKVLEDQNKDHFLAQRQRPRINLMITTHTISSKKNKEVLIPLPHPIFNASSEICVFTSDVDEEDKEVSIDHFEEMFKNKVGFVPKIVPMLSLRKDYRSYETKRHLCDAFDIFFTDERITKFLPTNLGKYFIKKKKMPIQFDITSSDLRKEFMLKVSSAKWIVTGNGNCSMVHVAYANYTPSDIVDNIEASIVTIAAEIMRGWSNVRSLYIKSDDSLAIPLYINDEIVENLHEADAEEVEYIRESRKRSAFKGIDALDKLKFPKPATEYN